MHYTPLQSIPRVSTHLEGYINLPPTSGELIIPSNPGIVMTANNGNNAIRISGAGATAGISSTGTTGNQIQFFCNGNIVAAFDTNGLYFGNGPTSSTSPYITTNTGDLGLYSTAGKNVSLNGNHITAGNGLVTILSPVLNLTSGNIVTFGSAGTNVAVTVNGTLLVSGSVSAGSVSAGSVSAGSVSAGSIIPTTVPNSKTMIGGILSTATMITSVINYTDSPLIQILTVPAGAWLVYFNILLPPMGGGYAPYFFRLLDGSGNQLSQHFVTQIGTDAASRYSGSIYNGGDFNFTFTIPLVLSSAQSSISVNVRSTNGGASTAGAVLSLMRIG